MSTAHAYLGRPALDWRGGIGLVRQMRRVRCRGVARGSSIVRGGVAVRARHTKAAAATRCP